MRQNLHRLTALLLACVMCFSMLLIPSEASYSDVPDASWYETAVEYVSQRGWMTGVSETEFAPKTELTRAMFVLILARFANATLDDGTAIFEDVPAGKWYSGAVAWAYWNNIATGVDATHFAPNKRITRQELCTMLLRYVEKTKLDLPGNTRRVFLDSQSISAYAVSAVEDCVRTGLISGFEDSTFRPKSTATRAQAAAILMKLDQAINAVAPAQSFDAPAEEGISVSVNAPQGALPAESELTVTPVSDETALDELRDKVYGTLLAAADISFEKDGEELEPNAAVEVQLSLSGLENVQYPAVAHILDDGTAEVVSSELISRTRSGRDRTLRFYASSFSIYVVFDGGDVSADRLTVNFWARKDGNVGPATAGTGNWETINVQSVVKNFACSTTEDQLLIYDPGVPALTTGQAFEGWTQTADYTDSSEKLTVQNISDLCRTASAPGSATTELNFYAITYNVLFVNYHDQYGNTLRIETVPKVVNGADSSTAVGHGKASVTTNLDYATVDDDVDFRGWVTANHVETYGEHPTYSVSVADFENGQTAEVLASTLTEDTLDLYPFLQAGHWIVFDADVAGNNARLAFDDPTRASYTAPLFVPTGTNLSSVPMPTPERHGYRLDGWYKTDGTPFTWSGTLAADLTLKARWEFESTTYRVQVWMRDADGVSWVLYTPTYDGFTAVRSVATGTAIDISSESALFDLVGDPNTNKIGYYYEYVDVPGKTNLTGPAYGDGRTTLNLYYDTKMITYRFLTGNYHVCGQRVDSSTVTPIPNDPNGYKTSGYYVLTDNYDFVKLEGTPTNGVVPTASATFTQNGNVITNKENVIWFADSQMVERTGKYGTPITSEQQVDFTYGWDPVDTNNYNYIWYSWNGKSKVVQRNPIRNYKPADTLKGQTTVYYITVKEAKGNMMEINFIGEGLPGDPDPYGVSNSRRTRPSNLNNAFTTSGKEFKGFFIEKYYIDTNGTGPNYEDAYSFPVESGKSSWAIGTYEFLSSTDKYNDYTHVYFQKKINGEDVRLTKAEMVDKTLYLFYHRLQYDVYFYSSTNTTTNALFRQETLYYEQPLSAFETLVPDNGPTGYYFAGWYVDPGFEKPFDFSATMPYNDVALYARWVPIRYRYVLDYTGGNADTGITPATGTFVMYQNDRLEKDMLASVAWDGHILVGWYLDPQFQHPFSFESVTGEALVIGDANRYYGVRRPGESKADYEARMANATQRPYGDDAAANSDVRYRITLYAKWGVRPAGVPFITVSYDGDQSADELGYFAGEDSHTRDDPNLYNDQSDAIGQQAPTPIDSSYATDTDRKFLCWEILDSEGEPTGKEIFPGEHFQVSLEDAHRIPGHVLSAVVETSPTCTGPWYAENYQICSTCGLAFSATDSSRVVPQIEPISHTYNLDVSWSGKTCTLSRICTVCGHVEAQHVSSDAVLVMDDATHGHYEVTIVDPTFGGDYESPQIDFSGAANTTTLTLYEQTASRVFTVPQNTTVTLPGLSNSIPSGWTSFVGWKDGTYTSSTTPPAYTAAGATLAIGDTSVTRYALYSDSGTGYYSTATSTYTVNYVTYIGADIPGGTFVDGETVTLPSAASGKASDGYDYTFCGWKDGSAYADSATVPTGLYNAGATFRVTSAGSRTFHAVYSYSDATYSKVTEVQTDWTGTYLLGGRTKVGNNYVFYLMGNENQSGTSNRVAADMLSSNAKQVGDKIHRVKSQNRFQIDASTINGQYRIRNGSLYLLSKDKNSLQLQTPPSNFGDQFEFVYNRNPETGVYCFNSVSRPSYNVTLRDDASPVAFGTYSNLINKFGLYLWKKDAQNTTFYVSNPNTILTSSVQPDPEVTESVSEPSHSERSEESVTPVPGHSERSEESATPATPAPSHSERSEESATPATDETAPADALDPMRFSGPVGSQDGQYTVTFMDQDGVTPLCAPFLCGDGGDAFGDYPYTIPTAPTRDGYYFAGWYESGEAYAFDFDHTAIGNDVVLYPHYEADQNCAVYQVQLRAKYIELTTVNTLQVRWYSNKENPESYFSEKSDGLGGSTDRFDIGEFIATLPKPYSSSGGDTLFDGNNDESNEGLYNPGHVFLGWAKVSTAGGDAVTDLNEDDLFLKWSGSSYLAKNGSGNWAAAAGIRSDEISSDVALYAVWGEAYYVVHSSDGTLEQRLIRYDDGEKTLLGTFTPTRDGTGPQKLPVDLTSAIPTGYLYAGYYTGYADVDTTDVSAEVEVLESGDASTVARSALLSRWAAPNSENTINFSSVTNNPTTTSGVNIINRVCTVDDEFTAYTGQRLTGASTARWPVGNAYNDPEDSLIGDDMTPTAGEVYYLKEVPDNYLTNRYSVLYKTNSDPVNQITRLYLFGVTDDRNYREIGFKVATGASLASAEAPDVLAAAAASETTIPAVLTSRFVIASQVTDASNTYNSVSFGAHAGGYLAINTLAVEPSTTYAVRPYWVTLDGITVYGKTAMIFNINANKTLTLKEGGFEEIRLVPENVNASLSGAPEISVSAGSTITLPKLETYEYGYEHVGWVGPFYTNPETPFEPGPSAPAGMMPVTDEGIEIETTSDCSFYSVWKRKYKAYATDADYYTDIDHRPKYKILDFVVPAGTDLGAGGGNVISMLIENPEETLNLRLPTLDGAMPATIERKRHPDATGTGSTFTIDSPTFLGWRIRAFDKSETGEYFSPSSITYGTNLYGTTTLANLGTIYTETLPIAPFESGASLVFGTSYNPATRFKMYCAFSWQEVLYDRITDSTVLPDSGTIVVADTSTGYCMVHTYDDNWQDYGSVSSLGIGKVGTTQLRLVPEACQYTIEKPAGETYYHICDTDGNMLYHDSAAVAQNTLILGDGTQGTTQFTFTMSGNNTIITVPHGDVPYYVSWQSYWFRATGNSYSLSCFLLQDAATTFYGTANKTNDPNDDAYIAPTP